MPGLWKVGMVSNEWVKWSVDGSPVALVAISPLHKIIVTSRYAITID